MAKNHSVKKVIAVWDIGIVDKAKALEIESNITKGFTSVYGNKVRGGAFCREDGYYTDHGFGVRYVQQFKNVTKEVMEKLNLIEARGWV